MIFAEDICSFVRYQGFPLFSAVGTRLHLTDKVPCTAIEISSKDFPVRARGDNQDPLRSAYRAITIRVSESDNEAQSLR